MLVKNSSRLQKKSKTEEILVNNKLCWEHFGNIQKQKPLLRYLRSGFLYPRRESNPYQQNRNLSFYPLNYGGRIVQRTKLQHFRRYYKFLCFSPRKKNVKTIYKVVAGAESLRKSSSHRFCIKSCSMPRVVLLCGRSLEAGWLVIIIDF